MCFAHLLRMPAYFYDKQTSGQLLSTLIYNVEQVAAATTDALLMMVQEGFLALGLMIVMFTVSWQLTLLFLVAAPLMVFIFRLSSKKMRKQSTQVQHTMAEVMHVAEESIEGYKVIRTFGGEQYESGKFNRATELNREREMKVIVADSLGIFRRTISCINGNCGYLIYRHITQIIKYFTGQFCRHDCSNLCIITSYSTFNRCQQ